MFVYSLPCLFHLSISSFVAHNVVYYDTNILYCNINMESIMISQGEEFLIDWNICAYIELGTRLLGTVKRTVDIYSLFQNCLIIDVSLEL